MSVWDKPIQLVLDGGNIHSKSEVYLILEHPQLKSLLMSQKETIFDSNKDAAVDYYVLYLRSDMASRLKSVTRQINDILYGYRTAMTDVAKFVQGET